MTTTRPPLATTQPNEQLYYAQLLDWGNRIGLLVLIATFAAYAFGVVTPLVPLEQLPTLWTLPTPEFLARSGLPTGWGWIALIERADVAALTGIAILAGCSLVCLLALVPLYLRKGDRAYAALCLAEAGVVLLAASGVLTGGH
ncbi:MAG: hypothetical protein IPG93_21155 [Burkholderiales bacterium]|nr:hypothetical protein [Burkholderiales bacterium]